MKYLVLYLLLMFFGLTQAKTALAEENFIKFEIIEKPNSPDGILIAKLSNGSNFKIKTQKGLLPWFQAKSPIAMNVFCENSFDKLVELKRFLPSGHNYEEIEIKSKSTLEGEIYLNLQFPDLAECRKLSDVYIFWRFVFLGIDPNIEEENRGMIILPRGRIQK